jgi:putative phosphoesterase
MKIAIISDIHGNYEALRLFSETYDELWVLGDLVNFGPKPSEVVEWVRAHAHCVVRGNHDHAVGYGTDPRCIPAYQTMAAETSKYSSSVLTEDQKQYLRLLPLTVERMLGGTRFHLCHATPSDPLFGYLDRGAHAWMRETRSTLSDIVAVGHTHMPFLRSLPLGALVNPGSLAAFGTASPEASYATWEDGHFELKHYPYSVQTVVNQIRRMPVSSRTQKQMITLIHGSNANNQPHRNGRLHARESMNNVRN